MSWSGDLTTRDHPPDQLRAKRVVGGLTNFDQPPALGGGTMLRYSLGP